MRRTVLCVGLGCVLVASACRAAPSGPIPATSSTATATADDAGASPADPATPSPVAQNTMHPPVLVPLLVSLSTESARAITDLAGLVLETQLTPGTGCLPSGTVLAQEPPAERMASVGDVVHVQINDTTLPCNGELPPAPDQLAEAADLFVQFARGQAQGPAGDTPVTLYLGGHPRGSIDGDAQRQRENWRLCPSGGYAGRTCPFSALDNLAQATDLATTMARPTHACLHAPPLDPGSAGGTYLVTITPRASLDCVAYWAVQLVVNDAMQLVAVDLVLSEP